jgi:serine/threonine protein kinase
MAPGRVNQAWMPNSNTTPNLPASHPHNLNSGSAMVPNPLGALSSAPVTAPSSVENNAMMVMANEKKLSSAATTNIQDEKQRKKITYALPNQCMEQGHFYVVLGEDVDVSSGRYKILSLLGQGTFGKVVEAWDRKRKQYCAVKIVRNVPKYTRDAAVEVQYMQRLASADPSDRYTFVKPWKHFLNDQGHMCIVMPKFGPCLLDFLQKFGPMSLHHIADVAHQMALGLNFLHNEVRLMHTDLKPENILLERADYTTTTPHLKIRMCDLGGCTDERHTKYAIVSTRHYRAPEVLLGLGWMYGADMWSTGCILYEMFTGRLLFDTHDNLEHLHMMSRSLGPVPQEWANECYEEAKALYHNGQMKPVPSSSTSKLGKIRPLREVVKDEHLLSLLQGLLCYDKNRRMTPQQMLAHPFITKYASTKAPSL